MANIVYTYKYHKYKTCISKKMNLRKIMKNVFFVISWHW